MPPLLRTWLQLLRAPNLFTVPGDPLAGYLLACYGAVEPRVLLPVFASLCFYSSGLLVNDLAFVVVLAYVVNRAAGLRFSCLQHRVLNRDAVHAFASEFW